MTKDLARLFAVIDASIVEIQVTEKVQALPGVAPTESSSSCKSLRRLVPTKISVEISPPRHRESGRGRRLP